MVTQPFFICIIFYPNPIDWLPDAYPLAILWLSGIRIAAPEIRVGKGYPLGKQRISIPAIWDRIRQKTILCSRSYGRFALSLPPQICIRRFPFRRGGEDPVEQIELINKSVQAKLWRVKQKQVNEQLRIDGDFYPCSER